MSYTFHSRATADLIMLRGPAEHILQLLGRPLNEPGVLTVEQIPQALEVLEHAAQEDDARRKAIKAQLDNDSEDLETRQAAAHAASTLGPVSLRHRLVPFFAMLRESAADNKPVTWDTSK